MLTTNPFDPIGPLVPCISLISSEDLKVMVSCKFKLAQLSVML